MKQLVVETNNPTPTLWDTPVPDPGPASVGHHPVPLSHSVGQQYRGGKRQADLDLATDESPDQ